MPNSRFPKICLLKQISLMSYDKNLIKYNSANQINKIFFEPINKTSMWENISHHNLIAQKQSLCEAYQKYLYASDVSNLEHTTSLIIYSEIDLQYGAQQYLKLKLPLKIVQVAAQIRLLNRFNCRIVTNSKIFKLKENSYCHLCCKPDTFLHMIIDCEKFIDKRKNLNLPKNNGCTLNIFEILEKRNKKTITKLVVLSNHILYVTNP